MGRLFTRQAKEQGQRDELLSAYLDGGLSARERARLEAQLATDPALRAELETLRHTVALMHELPSVPLPRNFVLPQTMATRPRPAPSARLRRVWAAPALMAATAVVSFLFVVVVVGDLLFFRPGGATFAPAAEPPAQVALEPSLVSEEPQAEEAVHLDTTSTATPPPMVMEAPAGLMPTAIAEAERYAVGVPESVDATVPAGGGGPVEDPTAPAPAPGPAMEGSGPTEEPTAPPPTAGPPGAEEAAAVPTATAVLEKGMDGAELTPGEGAEVAPWATGEEEPEVATGGRGAPESEVAALATISPWRVLEVILGLTALGLALATVWAWRARRR